MKKVLTVFATVALVATLFTSCKKDYTCTCTVTGGVSSSTTINASKKDAKTACEAGTIAGIVTCAIK